MTSTIEKREARLLRWEAYLRRTRHVAFWFGVLVIVTSIALIALDVSPAEDESKWMIWVGAFLLALAYEAHLKVRHIESIRFHREVAECDGECEA